MSDSRIALVTADEYEIFIAQPEHRDRRFQLIDGRIVEKVPTLLHAAIVHLLSGFVFVYLRANPIGRAYVEGRYRLPESDDNARIPDFSFVAGFDRPVIDHGPAPFMPDWAVEVVSPDDKPDDLEARARYFLEHGTRLVWIIDPRTRRITVHTSGSQQIYSAGQMLDGGDLLPGFSVALTDLFPS
jgi:Uma2 family endonuclease